MAKTKSSQKASSAKKTTSSKKSSSARKASSSASATDIQNERTMASLAYLVFFLPLLVTPDSKFGRYHANQGLVLLIIYVAVAIIISIFQIILPRVLFWLTSFLSAVSGVAMVVFIVIGILNASKGVKKPLPLIGDLFTIIN